MTYQEKKEARIERLRARAERKQAFANDNGLDLYGEAKSGIPLGQPILVGHHSERRHRRHLERIESRVRRGFEAEKEAERLRRAADAAESRTAIDSDNPEAETLIKAKIERLTKERDLYKTLNLLVRKCDGDAQFLSKMLLSALPEKFKSEEHALKRATQLLTPDFAGRLGIPGYVLTNTGTEIRRLNKRLTEVSKLGDFESFEVNGCQVDLHDGQVQVAFPWKPNDETRHKLKCSPLALKWSRYSERWVRKHTAATSSRYFIETLKQVLSEAAE